MSNRTSERVCSVLNVIIPLFFAFLVGAIFALIAGYNPITVYGTILAKGFGSIGGIMQSLGFATPLIMTGIATAFAFKSGIWNIGVEGQLYMGAMATALIGGGYFGINLPAGMHVVVALLAGALLGMLFACIPAALKAFLGVNEVVTTIMLNFAATYFTTYLVKCQFQGSATYDSTESILSTAIIPKLDPRYRVTYALFLAIAIVMVIWFVSKRTKFGYEISAIGRQLEFSEAAGMRVKKKIFIMFIISGAIAGLAGGSEMLGVNKQFTPNFSTNPGLGWQGYFICVLSQQNPLAVLIIAIIFGGFRYGSIALQSQIGLPLDLLNIIQGSLILFYSIQYLVPGKKYGFFKPKRAQTIAKAN